MSRILFKWGGGGGIPDCRAGHMTNQHYIFTGICDSVHRGDGSAPGGAWSRGCLVPGGVVLLPRGVPGLGVALSGGMPG